MVGAGCHGRDQGALYYLMRRVLQKDAVLESARFILIAVAYDEFIVVLVRRDHCPLTVSREAGAPHAAQVGLLDHTNDALRVLEGVPQARAAAVRQPGSEISADRGPRRRQNLVCRAHALAPAVARCEAASLTRAERSFASTRKSKLP